MLPDREKEVYEALQLTDTDEIEAGDQNLENVTDEPQNALTNDGTVVAVKPDAENTQESTQDTTPVNLPPMPESVVEGDFPSIED